MNAKESKLAWRYISLIESSKDNPKTKDLSGTEFKVLAYIGWRNGKAYIAEIMEHPAFKPFSLSTIKRAVLTLINNNLIETRPSNEDARVQRLSLKEK